ncbi:MAG: hypothetical protein RRC34_13290 [Lentisphaeria bacterium]|nr:hypothetical protein [Lentisphaeria bacterium]
MNPEYVIGPALLVILAIVFAALVNRGQKKCPFCRGMTIDFADMNGPAKGPLKQVMTITNQDLTRPRRIVICEKCHSVFDCRPRERVYRTTADGFLAVRDNEDRLTSGAITLSLESIHCRECGSPVTQSDDFSLSPAEKDFAYLQLFQVKDELSDRPAYLCRKCGAINIWRKAPGSDYFILTTHPALKRYPEAELFQEAKARAAYMEEISLGNAIWSFEPDRIVAKPPSFAKDPFGICNLAGQFVISRAAGTITCGKKNNAREWPLDGSWQVTTETFSTQTQLLEAAAGHKKTIASAAEVKLFSRKHAMSFIMHVGQKYACQEVADKIRRVVESATAA